MNTAYVVCDGLNLTKIRASVKAPQNDGTVLFELRYSSCGPTGYGPIFTGLSVMVNATPDSNPAQINAYCNEALGSTMLNNGDLVAIRVTRDDSLGSFSAAATVC